MKLFLFDHCPFCVRAMMIRGLKGLDIPLVYLQNEDVQARLDMVGANMVPILQKADGSFMAESLDIVAYLDRFDNQERLQPAQWQDTIQQYLDQAGFHSSRLLYPRSVLLGLPEFASDAAIAWFTKNKTAIIGMSFADAIANTATYLQGLTGCWPLLEGIPLPSARQHQLSYDDIVLFPGLRNLTMVKGITFSAHVRAYIDEVAALTGVPLYDAIAQ